MRGKSFFLSLVTDSLADRITEDCGISGANILLNGGGHFIMLVPNNSANSDYLKNFEKKIQKWFYINLKGELNVVFSVTPIGENLFKSFPAWYNNVTSELVKSKRQKGVNNLTEIFGYDLDSPDFKEFEFYLNEEEQKEFKSLGPLYEKNLYKLAKFFQAIGKNLPNAEYFLRISGTDEMLAELGKIYRGEVFRIHPAGYSWYFAEDENELFKAIEKIKVLNPSGIKIIRINDAAFIPDFTSEKLSPAALTGEKLSLSLGFRFTGNYAPKKSSGEVMEFEEMAKSFRFYKKPAESTGNADSAIWKMEKSAYPLLGFVRMDIDNLGSVFSIGLEREEQNENIKTLTRVVNLSRDFNNFFGGYLNKIAERWDMYITYSGGDDLCAVGSWVNCINFAADVRSELREFTCHNPNITISGGIFLCKPNFPAGKASEKAGEAEDMAKKRYRTKDCISVFNRTFRWDKFEKFYDYALELDTIINFNETAYDIMSVSGIPALDYNKYFRIDEKSEIKTSLLHFILTLTNDMFTDIKGDEGGKMIKVEKFNILYKLKYHLARSPRNITAERIKNPGTEGRKKVELLSKILNDAEMIDYLDNFIIPAAYNIYKYRSFKKNQE